MLYIGFFSFYYDDPEHGLHRGSFNYVVEAHNIHEACQIMAEQISQKHVELLNGTEQLMLDNVIEVAQLPAQGFLANISYVQGDPPVLHCDMLDDEAPGISNFRQGPDPDEEPEAYASFTPEPFLVFEDEPDSDQELVIDE